MCLLLRAKYFSLLCDNLMYTFYTCDVMWQGLFVNFMEILKYKG
jgi:hypothetical protein